MKTFIRHFYEALTRFSVKLQSLSLLFLRLILAYGFFEPAMSKWKDIESVGNWFADMGYPFPHLNAYLAASTELAGVFLLFLGLATRIISPLLIFVMIVAITTVHLRHGFDANNHGFEIPLYYALMLFVLFTFGPGKYSLDYLLCKGKEK